LALFLDSPRSDLGLSCDAGDPVLLRLRYRGGRALVATAAGCDPELLSTPSGVHDLSPIGSVALSDLYDPPLPRRRLVPTLDYIGESLGAAARSANATSEHATAVQIAAYEFNDPGAPFERVLWQNPLPGGEQAASSESVDLIVATHPAPPCRADQLLGRYENGGYATQDHFGNIDLLDASPRACTLQGRLTLRGVARDGRGDTDTASERVGSGLVLSPRATLRGLAHDPAAALIATFGFAGGTTGDPYTRDDLCTDHEITPSAWSLTLGTGGTLRLPNGAPGEGGPFYSCLGTLSSGLGPTVGLLSG
jgi:hypothetical protein